MDKTKSMIERGISLFTDRKYDRSQIDSIRKLFLDDVENGMTFTNFFDEKKYVINKDTGYTSRRFETPLPGNDIGYRYVNPEMFPREYLGDKALKLMKHVEGLVGLTGIYSSKYEKKEKEYGGLTLSGQMRILLYNLQPYFNKGMLRYNGAKIEVNSDYNSPYINNVVADINKKLSIFPESAIHTIIKDSTFEMTPIDEVKKEYRNGPEGVPFYTGKEK